MAEKFIGNNALAEKFIGNNASNLSLTYAEAKEHMSSATYRKALKELIDKEIIIVMRPGGLGKGCTIYSIANKWWSRKMPRRRNNGEEGAV